MSTSSNNGFYEIRLQVTPFSPPVHVFFHNHVQTTATVKSRDSFGHDGEGYDVVRNQAADRTQTPRHYFQVLSSSN